MILGSRVLEFFERRTVMNPLIQNNKSPEVLNMEARTQSCDRQAVEWAFSAGDA